MAAELAVPVRGVVSAVLARPGADRRPRHQRWCPGPDARDVTQGRP